MRIPHTLVGAALLMVSVTVRLEAQGTLDAARDLYASAEYERALTMLDGLGAADRSHEEQRIIELYRVLCLVAIGKDAAATSAIEAFITRNPLYQPSDELPPRVRSTFNEARKRVLPLALQAKYQEAKGAFDAKDYVSAERGFAAVLEVLNDPDLAALATQPPLADLRTLASGFRDLSTAAIAPPPPPPAAAPSVAAAPPPATTPAPAPAAPRIYTADDMNVVPPVVLTQRIPPFPGLVRTAHAGVIEVVIDERGLVEAATMIASITPQYDRMALMAARNWLYQPARLDGVPVKFLKRIQVNLVPAT
jgi:hypothetical protein